MKKLFLALAITTFVLSSCSNDDETPTQQPVTMKVLQLGRGGTPGEPVIYSVVYGTSEEDRVYTEISEEVYNHYYELSMAAPNPRWRGEVTE